MNKSEQLKLAHGLRSIADYLEDDCDLYGPDRVIARYRYTTDKYGGATDIEVLRFASGRMLERKVLQ